MCSFVLTSGGWQLKVEPRLTLMKEDTTLYYLIRCFKDRVSTAAVNHIKMLWTNSGCPLTLGFVLFPIEVMTRTGRLDLTKDREKEFGNTNPAFCDVELDLTRSSISHMK